MKAKGSYAKMMDKVRYRRPCVVCGRVYAPGPHDAIACSNTCIALYHTQKRKAEHAG